MLTINQKNVKRSNDNSMFGHRGDVAVQDAKYQLNSFIEHFCGDGTYNDDQIEYIREREAQYADLISKATNDMIAREADNVSWVVAGPAKYNFEKYNKKMDIMFNKMQEFEDKKKRFIKNTERHLKKLESDDKQIAYWRSGRFKNGESIEFSDPLCLEKMNAKLEYLQEFQNEMKKANAYWKKNQTMTGFPLFSEEKNAMIDDRINVRKITSRPYEQCSMSNTSATIRDLKKRIEKFKNLPETSVREFDGFSIVINSEDDRIQILFDNIPDSDMRERLKSSGWRWSPKNKAWQRKCSLNSKLSAESILEIKL
ncbi:hypothetical protein [Eubacterium sp.]|uniref:hypothetical protein n=1 Tax=Eubacterium sp. TaxID=142586 RepID=UPI002FCC8536